jgi:uncharacterized protein (DUF1499 family)
VVAIDEPGLTIHIEAHTFLFRFVDDVVVRLRRVPEGEDVLADVRSRSRVGRGDLGANARRIRDYLADLQTALHHPQR